MFWRLGSQSDETIKHYIKWWFNRNPQLKSMLYFQYIFYSSLIDLNFIPRTSQPQAYNTEIRSSTSALFTCKYIINTIFVHTLWWQNKYHICWYFMNKLLPKIKETTPYPFSRKMMGLASKAFSFPHSALHDNVSSKQMFPFNHIQMIVLEYSSSVGKAKFESECNRIVYPVGVVWVVPYYCNTFIGYIRSSLNHCGNVSDSQGTQQIWENSSKNSSTKSPLWQ